MPKGKMMLGDPATAQALQGLNQQLQGARTPAEAMGVQQQMNAAQLQGAQNLMAQAQNPMGPDGKPKQMLDPQTGYAPWAGQQQMAQQNLAQMQQAFGRNQLGIQQAANNANPMNNPMNALGVAGYYPAAGGASAAMKGNSALLSALGG